MVARFPQSRNLRKGRYSLRGNYYFLTTSVNHRRPIFIAPDFAHLVLNALRWLRLADRFMVDAAVVMPDHVQFAGQLQRHNLPAVMHTFKSFTANRLAGMGAKSPVWQDGYHDHGLRNDEDYCTRVRYLLDNPRRAGLVERTADYPYLIYPMWWVDAA